MLHRAAVNAYSWWWANHIRTKQLKWLEQNVQGNHPLCIFNKRDFDDIFSKS